MNVTSLTKTGFLMKRNEQTVTKPNRTEPNGTEPNRIEQNRTEPNRTEPNRTEPNRTEPNQTEPNRTEPKPNQTKPNQTKPNKQIKRRPHTPPAHLWMRPLTSAMTVDLCPFVAVRTMPGRSIRVRSGSPGACTCERFRFTDKIFSFQFLQCSVLGSCKRFRLLISGFRFFNVLH